MMFVDYLALTYKIPLPSEGRRNQAVRKGELLAKEIAHEIRVLGCVRVRGSTHQKIADYPDGTLVKLDFGGSVLPVDLDDFARWAKRWEGWTVSRLDVADNVTHAQRSKVKIGQANVVRWYESRSGVDGKVAVFTGCTLGKRGGCGSFYRLYDARKHDEGRTAKIARFGSCDFWRSEFELPREWLRRRGINCPTQLTPAKLMDIWRNECHSKGLQYDETACYVGLRPRDEIEVADELKQDRRLESIERQLYGLNLRRLILVQVQATLMIDRLRRSGFMDGEPSAPDWGAIPL
jgi:hypothetical protein